MKKITILLLIITLCLTGLIKEIIAAGGPPQKNGILPSFSLQTPKDDSLKLYLGLKGDGSFAVPLIKARIVIIEIFSMYCPYCQKEAPNINDLYALIENDPKLKGKVKIIGIGAGNTAYEVDTFRKTYSIPFPLFADEDFSLHKTLGEVRTPYFIAISIKKDGSHKVVYSGLGSINEPGKFLNIITRQAGIK
jgi:peroxiredoxin